MNDYGKRRKLLSIEMIVATFYSTCACIFWQELMRAKLPDTVIQIFEDAIDLANDSLMHLVFKYKGMKVLLFISLPYTLSVDILMSITYK